MSKTVLCDPEIGPYLMITLWTRLGLVALCNPPNPGITGASLLDCLVSLSGPSLGESYPSAKIQSVYSLATHWGESYRLKKCSRYILKHQLTGPFIRRGLSPLLRCSRCILQPQPTRPLVGRVLPLCRDAESVFFSPIRLDHGDYS